MRNNEYWRVHIPHVAKKTRYAGDESHIVGASGAGWMQGGPLWSPVRLVIACLSLALIIPAILIVFLVVIIFSSPPAHASATSSGNGRIYGQLLNGTKHNAPVAKQQVTLQLAEGNEAIDYATVTTGAQGSFSFSGLDTDKAISYTIYTNYEGAQYNTPFINLASKPLQQVNLTVYEATNSMANIAIVQATILLHAPDAQKGIVPVSELIIFRNLNNRTYVGSLNTSHGMPNALRFSLPHTAKNLSLSTGFNGYQAIQVDQGFATNAAVPPGDSQFGFTFDMPYTTSDYDFDYQILYPTIRLSMLIPVDIHASSDTLASAGPVTTDQQVLDVFGATALLPPKQVHVELEGLPVTNQPATAPASSSAFGSGIAWSWLILALLLMASAVLGTWFIYRSRRYPTPAILKKKTQQRQREEIRAVQDTSDDLKKKPSQQQGKKAATRAAQETADKVDKADKEQALLQELLDLDKAYEAGKLAKAEYRERRAKTKAQLRAIMSEKVTR